MKKIAFTFIPLMLAGFMIDGEQCGNHPPHLTRVDGPYLLYRNDKIFVHYIADDHGTKKALTDSMPLADKDKLSLEVPTDDPAKTFTVQLKKELAVEKSEFSHANRLFVLSDIEGNFGALRKLLQAGGVIDAAYNWTFGDGRLVLTGDFMDRGAQVTEVLWLIYALEEKAKTAGGQVHFILGNHEIMNMSGDLRYVQPKYIEHAGLLKEGYTALYGENAELGRWLRTKNVIEKIGPHLFTHGGVSANVLRLDLSVPKINKLVRPYYADSAYHYDSEKTDTLYSDLGPFWYRGYYMGNPAVESTVVDNTLGKYRVNCIFTGHTPVPDTIAVFYGGKLINTDVPHAKGRSEALLFENGNYYRVKPGGEKFLIKQ